MPPRYSSALIDTMITLHRTSIRTKINRQLQLNWAASKSANYISAALHCSQTANLDACRVLEEMSGSGIGISRNLEQSTALRDSAA